MATEDDDGSNGTELVAGGVVSGDVDTGSGVGELVSSVIASLFSVIIGMEEEGGEEDSTAVRTSDWRMQKPVF